MKISPNVAKIMLAAAVLGSATACTTGASHSGQVQEVEYGYYNSSHVFVYYSTPRTIYVTRQYYTSHSTLFANPSHHTYTVHTTTKTRTQTHPVTGKKTTTTTTRRTVRRSH